MNFEVGFHFDKELNSSCKGWCKLYRDIGISVNNSCIFKDKGDNYAEFMGRFGSEFCS